MRALCSVRETRRSGQMLQQSPEGGSHTVSPREAAAGGWVPGEGMLLVSGYEFQLHMLQIPQSSATQHCAYSSQYCPVHLKFYS